MHSGPALREIFLLPPKEVRARGIIYKFLRMPYGIFEAERQWLCVIEEWLLEKYGRELVPGIDQLLVLRSRDGLITLLVSKMADDFFIAGPRDAIYDFFHSLNQAFKLAAS